MLVLAKEHIKDAVFLYSIKKVVMDCLKLQEDKYSTISLGTTLTDDLGADSLDQMEVIMALEERFGLDEISEEDARKTTTIGHILEYLRGHCTKENSDMLSFSDDKFNKNHFLDDVEKITGVILSDRESINSIDDISKQEN